MAQQLINVGSSANDGTGDPARTAGQKINANFTELYGSVSALQGGGGLTGPLTLLAGSAASPSLRLTGDTDTGLFSGGAGVLGVAVDGTERARFTSSGLVLENALAIASGGTGASSASVARSNLGLAIGSQVQGWDADLDAIAALAGTSGLLRKTGAGSWALETASYLTANQAITFTGDATGSGTTAVELTLANSGVVAGSYANATVTVDAKGRVTAATANPAPVTSFSAGSTGLTPSVATSGAVVLGGTLGVANGGTGAVTLTGFVKGNGTGAFTAQAKIALADLDTTGTANSSSYLRGDGTWAGIAAGGGGTVTSVAVSGGTTGLTTSGGPITSAGTITLAGTLAVANGGTGATDAAGARTNLGAAAASHTHAIADVTGLQTALDGKAASSHTHTASQISDSTTTGRSVLTASTAANARSAITAASTGAVGSSGLTMSTARLLGRTTAVSGAIEELTAGAGLTLSGGSLSVSGGTLLNVQVFTSSGTYTRTSGATRAVVIAVGGGGGGGGGSNGALGGNGGNGGTTSFGSHVTAAGGSGTNSGNPAAGAGGTGGTGATIAIRGQPGGRGVASWVVNMSPAGFGGGAGGGTAGAYLTAGGAGVRGGGGGGVGGTNGSGCCAITYTTGGGGQGETAIDYITTGLNASETVTIGAGGTGGTSNTGATGGAGGAGYIIVYEYS